VKNANMKDFGVCVFKYLNFLKRFLFFLPLISFNTDLLSDKSNEGPYCHDFITESPSRFSILIFSRYFLIYAAHLNSQYESLAILNLSLLVMNSNAVIFYCTAVWIELENSLYRLFSWE
jgi:hypothetical protein